MTSGAADGPDGPDGLAGPAGLAGLTQRAEAAVQRRTTAFETQDARATAALQVLSTSYDEEADARLAERLDSLAELFGLTEPEADLLLAAAAADLDANLALVFGLLRGSDGALGASVGLGLELSGLPTTSPHGFAFLSDSGPLRLHGLVEVRGDGPWLLRELAVPDRVVAHLAGAEVLEALLADAVVPTVPLELTEGAPVVRALAAGASLVWVRSAAGTAGASLAAGALAALGLGRLTVDLSRVTAHALGATVGAAAREAALRGVGLVVLGADPLGSVALRRALATLEATPVPVLLVGRQAWDATWLPQHPLTVDAPRLTATQRRRLWEGLTGTAPPDGFGALRLSPEQATQVDSYSRVLALAHDAGPDAPLDVLGAARVVGGSLVGGKRPTVGFEDLVLPPTQEAQLRRIVAWARHHDQALDRSGMFTAERKGGGIAALFSGGPGTGKTLSASVIAGELELDLFQVNLSQVVDKYIGETEKNLERIFDQAESMNVVLFFDEADALFGKRSEVKDAHDRYANQEVSYLLQRLEQFDGLTILCTNLRANLDAAFTRRLQFMVHFPDPDVATRRRLWELHLSRVAHLDPDDPVVLDHLAERVEVAGGDLRNIVLAGVYDATAAGEPLGMRHLVAAVPSVYQKLGLRMPADGFGVPG